MAEPPDDRLLAMLPGMHTATFVWREAGKLDTPVQKKIGVDPETLEACPNALTETICAAFGVSAVQPYPAFFVTLNDVCVPISLVAKHFVKLCGPNVVLVISTPESYTVDAHGRASLGTMASTLTPTAPVHDDRPAHKAKAKSDGASHSEGKARPASLSDGLSVIRQLAAAHADRDKRGDLLNWERQSHRTKILLREKMREEPRLKHISATYLNEKMTAHLKYKASLARKIRRDDELDEGEGSGSDSDGDSESGRPPNVEGR
eukprot:jgi/Mesvir1/1582/Mv14551-RA.1